MYWEWPRRSERYSIHYGPFESQMTTLDRNVWYNHGLVR